MIRHFEENTEGTDYVVGDIHGCFGEMFNELANIGFDSAKDRLFSVGDLVDRGPNSQQSLGWLETPYFHAVRGNHEQMAIDYYNGLGSRDIYRYNGGEWFLDLSPTLQRIYAEAFLELPIAIDVKRSGKLYGIVHADCPTASWNDLAAALEGHNKESYENQAMWSRDRISGHDTGPVKDVELVYVGHTPLKEADMIDNVVYIDTGVVFGGKLTVLKLGETP